MKKYLSVIFATLMVFAVAANASASLEEDSVLIASWNDSKEVVLNLGTMDSVVAATTGTVLGSFADADVDLGFMVVDFVTFGGFDNIAAFSFEPGQALGFATSSNGEPNVAGTAISNFSGGAGTVARNFVSHEVHNVTDDNSFVNRLNDNGGYGGFNLDMADGAMNMDNGDFTAYFFLYDTSTGNPILDAGPGSPYILALDIQTDGTILKGDMPAAVPVPGAVWLLGSALLGVVGLRKKNK